MPLAGGWGHSWRVRKCGRPMAGASDLTGGNHVGNGRNVGDNGDNHYHYHIEEVKHSNNEHPEFPATASRLEQPVNRR